VSNILSELKRRNVFRVGAAYIVVSWLILQVVETVSGPLNLPEWTAAFFIVVLAAGLPLVLIFAWAFELTPEGLRKTQDVDRSESVTADTGKKLNYAIMAVMAVALVYFIWERQLPDEPPAIEAVAESSSATPEDPATGYAASVAVLPFVDMSADSDHEYFSDGISEELLNLLAKIPELRVPARTSSFQFKGQNTDIAEIARQLNVAHVLEGSVRKADVRIRVTAQLIEAETGYHLWSETYDRELTDIFGIQDEISAAIVEALSETLGIRTTATPHVIAAANPEAYNYYLLGQHLIKERTKSDIEASIPNFDKAVELDPDYAPAHASLGLAWHLLIRSGATYGTLTLEESNAKALPHVERALQLDPQNPDALGTMGLIQGKLGNVEEAIDYFERALAINPSQTDIRNWYSSALTSVGRHVDSFAEMQKAYEFDPLSILTLNNYVNDLTLRREYDAAEPLIDRLNQLDPARAAMFRSGILSEQHREADAAVEMLRGADQAPGNLRVRASAAFNLLEFGLIDDALQVWPYPNVLPIINATDDADHALELAKQQFEDDPTDPVNVQTLAWAYWAAGDKEQATRNARRYLNSVPASRRPLEIVNWMFMIDAWQQGDEETMLGYMGPLAGQLDGTFESGIDSAFLRLVKASILYMKGETEDSLEALDVALSRNGGGISSLRNNFEVFGWNDIPEYAERKRRYDQYLQDEKTKFLKVACGADGFTTWQPSPDTCAEIDSI
jgi:TolB-like protein/Flp pilus assembly protein TadD